MSKIFWVALICFKDETDCILLWENIKIDFDDNAGIIMLHIKLMSEDNREKLLQIIFFASDSKYQNR